MKILILDFPSQFYFPPYGYGGIERWLWSVAKQSIALGHEVILSGNRWRIETLNHPAHFSERINKDTFSKFKKKFGKVDIVVGGHEYWANKEIVDIFNQISDKTFTYQLINKEVYKTPTFDNDKNFLFCFSEEMEKIFSMQSPTLIPCSSEGYNEDPIIHSSPEEYLVWVGRLDEDKSPHYAALAAIKMKMPLYILGNVEYQPRYMKEYEHYFRSKYIKLVGVCAGKKKSEIISKASAAIYTCSRSWVEAAGMVFSEYLRSGIPIAAMSWRSGTSAYSAIDTDTGQVSAISNEDNEEEITDKVITAINYSLNLDRDLVFRKGSYKFSPSNLVQRYIKRVYKNT